MKYYGTKNNKDYGFYENNFQNAIEITDKYWKELLTEQNGGKIIILFENKVVAVNENEYELQNGVWRKLSTAERQTRQLTIQNAVRAEEIRQELDLLDRKRIRAIAEPSLMDENTTWLEYYNTQISQLREELASIS